MTTDTHARIDLRLETRGAGDTIAWVTIDNVRKLNCLSSALMTAFVDTIEQLGRRDDLRAIVVTGAGDKAFVAVAADAGGVATGPLANSFLLALALGLASAADGADPLLDGLGLVALIALAPILSVMTLGLVIRWRTRPEHSRK